MQIFKKLFQTSIRLKDEDIVMKTFEILTLTFLAHPISLYDEPSVIRRYYFKILVEKAELFSILCRLRFVVQWRSYLNILNSLRHRDPLDAGLSSQLLYHLSLLLYV